MATTTPAAPATGLVYADLPNRIIAFIIDAIVIFILLFAVGLVLGVIGLATGGNAVASLIYAVLGIVVGAAYFIYTWTANRATIGMKALGMQIGNAGDGVTLTMDQAIRRYLALAAPSIIAQAFSGIALIGVILSLASLAWVVFLLWTTYKSPTKQGWHDVFANTQVVKAAKTV